MVRGNLGVFSEVYKHDSFLTIHCPKIGFPVPYIPFQNTKDLLQTKYQGILSFAIRLLMTNKQKTAHVYIVRNS